MAPNASTTKMTHRFLGKSGLLVSKPALGSWVDYNEKYTVDGWYEMMKIAFEHGVNFYDTAEKYGSGQAEELMGGAIGKGIAEGVWIREDLVISSKLFTGGPNDDGVSRKHIIEGLKASLHRLQLDYVDVVFWHRFDAFTPIEETVRAMNFVINQGWALYWGTSEWLASDIREACMIADRLGLTRPIVEQSQYNIFERNKVEFEYVDLYKKYKLGLTTYIDRQGFDERVEMANRLTPIAKELGTSLAQMSIAWAVANDNVSTVLLGASRPSQLEENLKSLEVVNKITPEVKAKINEMVKFVPTEPKLDQFAHSRGRHL